jgi:hypothetical protein
MMTESPEARITREQYWDGLASNPAQELAPTDAQRDAPAGFQLVIDPYRETVRLFGPYSEQGVSLKTLVLWGGVFKIRAEDLLRGYVEVCERGEPRDLHERVRALRERLQHLPAFTVPEKAPMDRIQLDAHLDNCETCAPAMAALSRAIDGGRSLPKEQELRDIVKRAHDDIPPPAKLARRAAQPTLAAAGKES